MVTDRSAKIFYNEDKTEATFHDHYNSRLDPGEFEFGVKEIIFNCEFNQLIDQGVIPNSVTLVTLGGNFNQPLSSRVFVN